VSDFASIRDGQLGRVALDAVAGVDGPMRLCELPTGRLRRYLPGCPAQAPALIGSPAQAHDRTDRLVHVSHRDVRLVA
jgi:hypothetical protein